MKPIYILFIGVFLSASSLYSSDLAQANNPLANMTAFNIQNYYIGELTDVNGNDSGEDANQAWLRFAEPFKVADTDWLLRASLPINSFPIGTDNSKETGIGDFNVFSAYMIDIGNPAVSFGVGPQLTLPTAKDGLGSDKYSAGLVNVLFDASSSKFQYGYLLSWQGSFAGDSNARDVNIAALQPFAMLQLGGGTYLRSAAIWYKDFDNDNYTIPLSLGVGQIFKKKKTVYNFFIEPQYSVIDDGAGIAKWQIYMGLNLQFLD